MKAGHMSGAVSIWKLARLCPPVARHVFILQPLHHHHLCGLVQKCCLWGGCASEIEVACLHPVSLGSQLSNYHLDKTEVAHCSLFGTLPLRQKHCHSLCPTGKTSQNVTKHHITCFAFIPRKIHSTIFKNFDHQTPLIIITWWILAQNNIYLLHKR